MSWDGPWSQLIATNYEQDVVKRTRKNISQEGIDKLIYDALSSDQGLASLASAENLTGGSKSSSKTLLAQDLMTKLIGELALVTAETEESTGDVKTSKEGRFLNKTGDNFNTVICTELKRQGVLSSELCESVGPPWKQVPYFTWRGYYFWAQHIAKAMRSSPRLTSFFRPIVQSRYELLSQKPGFHFLGRLTKLAEPFCYILGFVVACIAVHKDMKNGRTVTIS